MKTQAQYSQSVLSSLQEFSALAMANTEKLVNLNLEQAKKGAELSVAAFGSALEVKDANGFGEYVTAQQEVAKGYFEGLVEDAKTVSKMGEETTAKVTSLVKENFAVA